MMLSKCGKVLIFANTLTNPNCMCDKIKREYAYYHLVKIFVFCIPTCYLETQKLKYTESLFCLFFFYGCEIWSTTEGRTQTEGIQEENAEENIWT
jgi:hypothetical protein